MKKYFEEPVIELLKLDAIEAIALSPDIPTASPNIGDGDDYGEW